MSGVIDEDGTQWEHCNGCTGEGTEDFSERGKWVRIEDLTYEKPSEKYPYGRDLCFDCAMKSNQEEIEFEPETVTIQLKGYGLCSKCLTNEALHKMWMEFKNPIPAKVIGDIELPEATGVWVYVCDDCKEK